MTAWAATTHTGDLDIYSDISTASALSNGTASGGAASTHGYEWNWNANVSPKTLNLTLSSCTITGKLNLPDGCKITITLNGTNKILNGITGSSITSSGSNVYSMVIEGGGTLIFR